MSRVTRLWIICALGVIGVAVLMVSRGGGVPRAAAPKPGDPVAAPAAVPAAPAAPAALPAQRVVDPISIAPLAPDVNPQVASVAEALRTGDHPERVSMQVVPAAFDAEGYARDPQAYLDVVEPGRVWQMAANVEGIGEITVVGSAFHEIPALGSASLDVRVPPGAPVTFTSLDLGAFINGLSSMTVAADAQGLARAVFHARAGTLASCTILAACPVTTGQVSFWVEIVAPADLDHPVAQAQP